MADDSKNSEIRVDGCVLWLIFAALAPITGGLYAIASAIRGLHG